MPGMEEHPDKLSQYKQWLADHGREPTIRLQIAKQAFSFRQPFDADELLAALEPRGRITRPAVYRTLAELALARMLGRIERNGRAVYVPE